MLVNSNIRNLFLGRLISTSGDSLYQIAVIWYIFDLTKNAFYTGLAVAIVMIPMSFNFLLGPIVEELNKSSVLLYSQLLQSLLMLFVPISILVGYESVVLVLIIMFVISFLENFQGTAEISIVPTIVTSENRGKFNSLINSSQQMIDITMKSIFAGFILTIGIQNIYFYNALTFILAALFFSMLKVNQPIVKEEQTVFDWSVYKKSLREGFVYFFTSKLFILCLPFLIANFSFGMTEAILPLYANIRGGGEQYGVLIIAITLGNLTGTMLAIKVMKYPLGRLMIILPFMSFIMWCSSIFISTSLISTALLSVAFIPFGMMSILLITFLQTAIDEHLLARVSSIIDSVLVSAMPLGALIGGILPQFIGVNNTMILSCLGLLVIAIYFLMNNKVRSLPKIEKIKL